MIYDTTACYQCMLFQWGTAKSLDKQNDYKQGVSSGPSGSSRPSCLRFIKNALVRGAITIGRDVKYRISEQMPGCVWSSVPGLLTIVDISSKYSV
eukprot:15975-Heterococcus_DN1.PRE.3